MKRGWRSGKRGRGGDEEESKERRGKPVLSFHACSTMRIGERASLALLDGGLVAWCGEMNRPFSVHRCATTGQKGSSNSCQDAPFKSSSWSSRPLTSSSITASMSEHQNFYILNEDNRETFDFICCSVRCTYISVFSRKGKRGGEERFFCPFVFGSSFLLWGFTISAFRLKKSISYSGTEYKVADTHRYSCFKPLSLMYC